MGSARSTPNDPARAWREAPPGADPFRALVETVTDYGIYLLDPAGFVRSWNTGAELIEGYRAEEVIGRHLSLFYPASRGRPAEPERALAMAARLGRTEDECWRVRKDGIRYWARVVLNALHDEDGLLYGYATIVRDLTEEKRREDELRRIEERSRDLREQAMRDPLTGAFNRRYLLEFLRGAIDRGVWMTASLLALDIDCFKTINDHHGHDAGDAVLVKIAELAGHLSRGSDRLFRIGGDEFLVYLPGVNAAEARTIAERLRDAVAQAPLIEQAGVTISIGVAPLRPEDSAETWIHAADGALYEAKRGGRNRVAIAAADR